MPDAETTQRPNPDDLPAIRQVMMPRDTNPQGTIFGGVILSLIDQAAFVEALRRGGGSGGGGHRWVTVAMNGVEFHEPVHVGDVVSLWARTARQGRTSLRVHVVVEAQAHRGQAPRRVTEAEVVLVAVDDAGRPVPIGGDEGSGGGPA